MKEKEEEMKEKVEEVKEFKDLGNTMQIWRDGRRNKSEGCERQLCNKVTCKDYERKECINRGKE